MVSSHVIICAAAARLRETVVSPSGSWRANNGVGAIFLFRNGDLSFQERKLRVHAPLRSLPHALRWPFSLPYYSQLEQIAQWSQQNSY
jgi:hypothetical protein